MNQIEIFYLSERKARVKKDFKVLIPVVLRNGGSYWLHITIPKDFEFDGGTIPRIFWTISGLTPWGYYTSEYALHDKLYVDKGIVGDKTLSRKIIDKILRKQMKEKGASWFKYSITYLFCRAFGWYLFYDIDKMIYGFIKKK